MAGRGINQSESRARIAEINACADAAIERGKKRAREIDLKLEERLAAIHRGEEGCGIFEEEIQVFPGPGDAIDFQ